jgi:phosphoribosylformylglycinamidine synthase subunit PurQ / glutaminase
MKDVQVLVLTGFGLNCDVETAYAFELAGAKAHRVHINALIDREVALTDFQIMVFGGGFSWGDDHGAGVLQAVRMKTNIGREILDFITNGNLVMGICNGFQVLVNLGLLPGFDGDYNRRSVALTHNDCGNFRNQWVNLAINKSSPCIFTKDLDQLELPIRHGEGKFVADPDILGQLIDRNQVVLQYADATGKPADGGFPQNPNGSIADIAGICDSTGRIFGLMPHPEAYNHWTNHPDWTREKERLKREGSPLPSNSTPALKMFENAVEYIQNGTP